MQLIILFQCLAQGLNNLGPILDLKLSHILEDVFKNIAFVHTYNSFLLYGGDNNVTMIGLTMSSIAYIVLHVFT